MRYLTHKTHFSYFTIVVIFVVNMTDYEIPDHAKCIGNGSVQDFANCIEENTRDYVKCDKPHKRSIRIYDEAVVPVIQPLNGSIGFNETSSMSLVIDPSFNTTYSIWFFDQSFSFFSPNPLVVPRTFLILKPSSYIILYLKVKIGQWYT